ncbi:hypothetical protein EW146_g6690 [Bondarzewia mesenterica]|uniref:Uncharacterized protein n=1 Tax=Bondarzewia mesenterica TaxID=1095465 RepID=A0A4S4LPU3_9AGAM|nr:hypothetical protein EW146_g6690 [Bondarzewia mesenterica]
MGSKRNKKRRAIEPIGDMPVDRQARVKMEEDQEAVASQLLRSSSSHFAVVSEVDYASLPPLPTSPRRAASVQTRGTYSVTVHDRKVEACTEFPNANPPINTPTRNYDYDADSMRRSRKLVQISPRDQSRLYRLRQDPSVASLLDMYDSHGQLDSKAFSNSPIKEGRAQVQRSGSTLRQLLGNPESDRRKGDMTEGDISWAERFLEYVDLAASPEIVPNLCFVITSEGETVRVGPSARSSSESLALKAPTHPSHTLNFSNAVHPDATLHTDHDHSTNDDLENCPAISSMEVELSVGSDDVKTDIRNSLKQEHSTPQRASEFFGFLLDKERRGNTPKRAPTPSESEPPLPPLPLTFDADSSSDGISPDLGLITAIPSCNNHSTNPPAPSNFENHADLSGSVEAPSSAGSIIEDPPQDALIMNRTPVALLQEGSRARPVQMTPSSLPVSRIPKGPRGSRLSVATHENLFDVQAHTQEQNTPHPHKAGPRPSQIPTRDILRATTNASSSKLHIESRPHTPARSCKGQKRSASQNSTAWSVVDELETALVSGATVTPSASKSKSSRVRPPKDDGKENDPSPNNSIDLSRETNNKTPLNMNNKSRLPVTPARTRVLFEPLQGVPSSPASSSELSPYAQQMMADARKTRARKEVGKKRSRFAVVMTSN